MQKLTNQEIVNLACEKIIQQGEPSIIIEKDENWNNGKLNSRCVYNSEDGKHCAAGWIVPESKRSELVECKLCTEDENLTLFEEFVENCDFLELIQGAHDNAAVNVLYNEVFTGSKFIENFKYNIRELCLEHKLTIPECCQYEEN